MIANAPARRGEAWIRSVPLFALLCLALFVALRLRLGIVGIILWYVGPPALAAVGAGLLFGALVSSLRKRHTSNRGRVTALLVLALLEGSLALYRVYPSSHDGSPSQARFRLPLEGPVKVAWGGARPSANYHVVLPDQRWAYDLLIEQHGRTFWGNGTSVSNYFAYDQPVLAPADAVVHSVRDGEPDSPVGRKRLVLPAFGNHVVLEIAPQQYLFVAHLEAGTIAVRPGDRVESGDSLGRVGNSGNSSEPHVHLHLQDTPRPFLGEGIPFFFYDYRQDGTVRKKGMPEGGRTQNRYIGAVVEQEARSPHPARPARP